MTGESRPRVPRHSFTSRLAREQYAALAWARLRIFVHSLRSRRGGLDLGAAILTYGFGLLIALGPSFGLGFGAWAAMSQHHPLAIVAEMWAVFIVWQFLSAMAPALAGQNPEMSHLLRYPLSFGSWILLYLLYGLISPSSIIGLLWCTALCIGIGVARPDLLGWAAASLFLFALFNLLLSRAILAWVERWMAQRRTREILTVVFLCVALGAQVLNPVLYQHGHSLPFGLSSTTLARISDGVVQSQRFLPPGVASASILKASLHDDSGAGMSLAWLLLWMAAAGGVLVIRLKAESRGENLSEAPRRSTAVARPASRQPRGSGFSGPVAAVFGKDLRYLLRSGPLLYALASPPVMVFLFSSFYRTGAYASISSGDALPLSLIWAFLGLTRLVYNNFGAEGAGIQSYFLSPTPLRSVVLGKNVLYLLLFGIEAVVIAALVIFRFGPPPPALAAATVAWLLFAVPANFAAGNVISILLPYRTSATRIKSESASLGNTFLSMFIQFAVLGVGVAVFLPLAAFGRPWLASLVLLLLAAISIGIYFRVLNRIDGMVERHRESITFQVMKMRA